MNLNLTNFLSATILTAQSMAGLTAQETKPTEDMKTFPMQMSIVYPMTTQGDQTVNYRYNLSFNLFSGKVGAVKGVEFGSLFNQVEWDVTGVQFAGLANKTRELTGVQFGGLANFAKTVNGIQFGGITNIADSVLGAQFADIANICKEATGARFAGIANLSTYTKGAQFAGITNISEKSEGAQFAGIANISERSEGVQFAGIANVSQEVSGTSFAGILNRTGTLQGVQFGLVNVIDTIESGASIALVNIVKKGFYREWSLSFADYQNVGLSFKMGTQKFYTILNAGANFMEAKLWSFGFGFGTRIAINRRFDFQPEIMSYRYCPLNFKNYETMYMEFGQPPEFMRFKRYNNIESYHLKFGFICNLNARLGIVVAPSFYYFNSDVSNINRVSKIPPFAEFERTKTFTFENRYGKIRTNHQMYHSFGAGISVGLVLR